MSWRVGVDVGGTFTDLVASDATGATLRFKVATTPRAPEEGLLAALRALLATVEPAEIVAGLAEAQLEYMDELASISVEGYLEARAHSPEELAELRLRLFRLILEVASGRTKVWSDRWGIHNDLTLFTPGPVT